MDERESSPAPQPPDGTISPQRDTTTSSSRTASSGVVGWVLLIALAIGVLALRFFGGGGC